MRLSAHDEHGMRLLLRIARGEPDRCMTTAVLAEREGMSMSLAGKVLRLLRDGGFVDSTRGNCGGYVLTRAPEEIAVAEVLSALGGRLYEDGFCEQHEAGDELCTNSVDCALRSLWSLVQWEVDSALAGVTLARMLGSERGGGALVLGGRSAAVADATLVRGV